MNDYKIDRRDFLKYLVATAASLGLVGLKTAHSKTPDGEPIFPIYLPLVVNKRTPPNLLGRVLHVHAPSVTNWHFDYDQYYGKSQAPGTVGVNQGVVDAMIDRGVTGLLGLPPSEIVDAWNQLIPSYSHGKMVAIKANLNNAFTCDTNTTQVNSIAQPINAVVRGLKLCGIRDQDIVVFDAIRAFPDRVFNELNFQNIQIHDNGCRGYPSTWNSDDPQAKIQFSPPSGSLPTVRLTDTLLKADYLINMPLMKGHQIAGVTLSFKNHFGSVNNPSGMHTYISTSYSQVDQYNALVDLYSNPHIHDKTVLTIGEGIYGSREFQNTPPQPWTTFDDHSPCSLFFSTDPVAIDCVMHDLLKPERGSAQPDTSDSYLKLAADAGLGVFENGDPWQTPFGSGYSQIDYERIEM
jgi:uncharacterized protein (DUF362 family)